MSLAKTTADVETPYGPAVVKRGVPIENVVKKRSATTGEWTGKDISGARWTYRLHLWTSDDDAALIDNQLIAKGTDSASGELDYYYPCGATVRAVMTWEIVEVDNDNADTDATSGQRERILRRWRQPIIDAP